MKFVPARHYTRANRRSADIWWIVIHDMEYPERPDGAEWCANFFAGRSAPEASAHYNVDNNSVVQSVHDEDIAWHAPPNSHSIGIEHAGYAAQSREQWLDAYSLAELRISAELVAGLCRKHRIPVRWLTPSDLRAGKRGITSHANVSRAFGMTNHHDPGPNFPVSWFLTKVRVKLWGDVPEDSEPRPKMVVAPYLAWKEWRLGEGKFKGHGKANPQKRPKNWKARVPRRYWLRLRDFLYKRDPANDSEWKPFSE